MYINSSEVYVSAYFVQGTLLGAGDSVVTETLDPHKVQSNRETRH